MESKSNEAVSKPEIFVLAAFAKLQIDFTSAYKDGWSANGIINLNNSIRDFSLTVAALPAKEIIAEALPIIIRQRTNDMNPSLVNDEARAAIAEVIANNKLTEPEEALIDDPVSARRHFVESRANSNAQAIAVAETYSKSNER